MANLNLVAMLATALTVLTQLARRAKAAVACILGLFFAGRALQAVPKSAADLGSCQGNSVNSSLWNA